MKTVMTGAGGFVGPYLKAELERAGHEVLPVGLADFDICDEEAVKSFLQKEKPQALFHLAGLSGYEQCLRDPQQTWRVNTFAVEALASAQEEICPGSHFLFVSSGKIYAPADQALKEDDVLKPADFYGLTKMAADMRLSQLANKLDLKIVIARAFNHTGCGQATGFLCPDLIDRLIRQSASSGHRELQLGSLTAPVDLSDVRDVVKAYRLLVEGGHSGAFNVGQGRTQTVAEIVSQLEEVIGEKIQAKEQQEWKRSYSETLRVSCIDKIKESCGWQPEIPLSVTLKQMWQDAQQ